MSRYLANSFDLRADSIDRRVLDELECNGSVLDDEMIEWPDVITVRIKNKKLTLFGDDMERLVVIGEGEQGFWATCAYMRTLQKINVVLAPAQTPV